MRPVFDFSLMRRHDVSDPDSLFLNHNVIAIANKPTPTIIPLKAIPKVLAKIIIVEN